MMVGQMETMVPMREEPKAEYLPGGELEDRLNGLRDSMVVVTDSLGTNCKPLKIWV